MKRYGAGGARAILAECAASAAGDRARHTAAGSRVCTAASVPRLACTGGGGDQVREACTAAWRAVRALAASRLAGPAAGPAGVGGRGGVCLGQDIRIASLSSERCLPWCSAAAWQGGRLRGVPRVRGSPRLRSVRCSRLGRATSALLGRAGMAGCSRGRARLASRYGAPPRGATCAPRLTGTRRCATAIPEGQAASCD